MHLKYTKNTFLYIIGFLLISGAIFLSISNSIRNELADWGNNITLTTYLKEQPDSIELKICEEKYYFTDQSPINGDTTNQFFSYNRNIGDHEDEVPCPAIMTIYYKDSCRILKLDSFKCNGCDVYHEYIIHDDSAYYKVVP